MLRSIFKQGFSAGAILTVLILAGCPNNQKSQADRAAGGSAGPPPAEYAAGEAFFNQKCSLCHGLRAAGTPQGPPLVHKIYEPNHHGDFSFHRAIRLGVQAHHWRFGNMPRIAGVSEADANAIIAYIRWLQRQAGIF